MSPRSGPAEIVDSSPDSLRTEHEPGPSKRVRRPKGKPPGWEPYGNAPVGIRRRYGGYLKRCHREPTVAIRLFCCECMGYSSREARFCEAKTCVFWPYNRRIFGGEK